MVATTDGERYDVRHQPVFNDDLFHPRCAARLPSGAICGRAINFVRINWLVPRTVDDFRSEGHWRHNPRPYRNR